MHLRSLSFCSGVGYIRTRRVRMMVPFALVLLGASSIVLGHEVGDEGHEIFWVSVRGSTCLVENHDFCIGLITDSIDESVPVKNDNFSDIPFVHCVQ